MYAFYELRGLKFEASERYEGGLRSGSAPNPNAPPLPAGVVPAPPNAQGLVRDGLGSLYRKAEGYSAKERLVYRGGWKNGLQHGQGTLFWEDNPPSSDSGSGSKGNANANAAAVSENGPIIRFVGRFRNGLLHGRGTEFDDRGEKVSYLHYIALTCVYMCDALADICWHFP
jgi:hypothetical protein